jgi:hypothetical protein
MRSQLGKKRKNMLKNALMLCRRYNMSLKTEIKKHKKLQQKLIEEKIDLVSLINQKSLNLTIILFFIALIVSCSLFIGYLLSTEETTLNIEMQTTIEPNIKVVINETSKVSEEAINYLNEILYKGSERQ